jgi:hypothetical protein
MPEMNADGWGDPVWVDHVDNWTEQFVHWLRDRGVTRVNSTSPDDAADVKAGKVVYTHALSGEGGLHLRIAGAWRRILTFSSSAIQTVHSVGNVFEIKGASATHGVKWAANTNEVEINTLKSANITGTTITGTTIIGTAIRNSLGSTPTAYISTAATRPDADNVPAGTIWITS